VDVVLGGLAGKVEDHAGEVLDGEGGVLVVAHGDGPSGVVGHELLGVEEVGLEPLNDAAIVELAQQLGRVQVGLVRAACHLSQQSNDHWTV
jgi:hypothetical protein